MLRVSRATEPIDVALLVDNSAAARRRHHLPARGLVERSSRTWRRQQDRGRSRWPIGRRSVVDYTDDADAADRRGRQLFAMPKSGMTLLDAHLPRRPTGWRNGKRRARSSCRSSPTASNSPTATPATSSRRCASAKVALHMVTIGQFYHSEEHGDRERSFLLRCRPARVGGQRISLLSADTGSTHALQRLARSCCRRYKVVYSRPRIAHPAREGRACRRARPGVTMRGAPARGENGA